MTAQEYLEQAKDIDRLIDCKKMQLSRLNDLATKTTATMNDDVVSHTRNVHSLQDIVATIIDMKNEIDAEIQRAFHIRQEIASVIHSLDDIDERLVLEYRYLCNLTWSQIADQMGYTERFIFKKHASALEKIPVPS